MQTEPRYSRSVPAEWSGATALLAKWLTRRCAVESLVHLGGSAVFLVIGICGYVFLLGAITPIPEPTLAARS